MIYKILSPGLSSKNYIWLTIITPKIYINIFQHKNKSLPAFAALELEAWPPGFIYWLLVVWI